MDMKERMTGKPLKMIKLTMGIRATPKHSHAVALHFFLREKAAPFGFPFPASAAVIVSPR